MKMLHHVYTVPQYTHTANYVFLYMQLRMYVCVCMYVRIYLHYTCIH